MSIAYLPTTPRARTMIAAEFDSVASITAAADAIAHAGYTRAEAYTPFHIEGLAETLGSYFNPVAPITLIAGMIGGLTGFAMCWYANVINYPLNIGGRPNNSWPAWIPITFELTVLFAGLSAAFGMLALNGLPKLDHPVFDIPNFARASTDRFFLCIETTDPHYHADNLRDLLHTHHALNISEVPA